MDNVQSMLDEIAILRRNRRLKGVTRDTSANVLRTVTSVTGDTLTPSNKNLPLEGEEEGNAGASLRARVLKIGGEG